MSITIAEPFDLRATLVTMKSAKEKGVNMNIWDRDIKAVEDAIATIEAIRAMGQVQPDRKCEVCGATLTHFDTVPCGVTNCPVNSAISIT